MQTYELLHGAGTIYVGPIGEAFPALDTTPAGNWVTLGETKEGVTVVYEDSIEGIRVDQETGIVKAIRTEEDMRIETSLAVGTLENLSYFLNGNAVTDTPAGSGTIGTREVANYRGGVVQEFSILFRATSPYGDNYPAQYELPRGYFEGPSGLEYMKDDTVVIPCVFNVMVDLTAATDAEKFGRLIAQDADALP